MSTYIVELLQDPVFPDGQVTPFGIADAGLVAAFSNQGNTANYVGMNFKEAVFGAAAPRNSFSQYFSTNSQGYSVGVRHLDDPNHFHAVWSDGIELSTLTDLPVTDVSVATAINDSQKIVGVDSSSPLGFMVQGPTGTVTRIPAPPGKTQTVPVAMNAGGDVVGQSDNQLGFVYSGGVSKSLPIRPAAINNQGLAVSADGPAFCDTRQIPATATIQPLPSGCDVGRFHGINDAGLAVGQAWKGNDIAHSIAFICQNGVSTDLNALVVTPGWTLRSAHWINNGGQIVGLGTFENELVGFVASPVQSRRPYQIPASAWNLGGILFGGVSRDGGGWIFIGGRPHPVGPWGPLRLASAAKVDTILLLALDEAAGRLNDSKIRHEVRNVLQTAVVETAKTIGHAKQETSGPGRSTVLSVNLKEQLVGKVRQQQHRKRQGRRETQKRLSKKRA